MYTYSVGPHFEFIYSQSSGHFDSQSSGHSESEFGDGTSSRFEGNCAQGCDAKIKNGNLLVIKTKDDLRNEKVKSG